MAGHSKWSQIKHKKAKNDKDRSRHFTKLSKEISNAARSGGGEIIGNPRLRLLVDKAREINMPIDNITRAIKRGTGELPGVSYEEIQYEGYGPGGIALIIEVLTDNRNKAAADLRFVFNRKGGNLAENGSVSWMFHKYGVVRIASANATEEKLLEALIDYEIEDIEQENGTFTITCSIKSLEDVRSTLQKAGYTIESAELEWIAASSLSPNKEDEEKAYELLQALEDLDDVQNVYTNLG